MGARQRSKILLNKPKWRPRRSSKLPKDRLAKSPNPPKSCPLSTKSPTRRWTRKASRRRTSSSLCSKPIAARASGQGAQEVRQRYCQRDHGLDNVMRSTMHCLETKTATNGPNNHNNNKLCDLLFSGCFFFFTLPLTQ